MERKHLSARRIRQEQRSKAVTDGSETPCPFIVLLHFVSKEHLQELCGTSDLNSVRYLEVTLDLQRTSIHLLLDHLPSLRQLILDYSPITSMRDLGVNVHKLTTISVSRCGLTDLDGISSLVSIIELRLSFNRVDDLTPLALHDTLEILDLSHNLVDDIIGCEILGTCTRLCSLDLRDNPVSRKTQGFRRTLSYWIPQRIYGQLQILDGKHIERIDTSRAMVAIANDACDGFSTTQLNNGCHFDSFKENHDHKTTERVGRTDGLSYGSFVIAGNTARSILRRRKTNQKKVDDSCNLLVPPSELLLNSELMKEDESLCSKASKPDYIAPRCSIGVNEIFYSANGIGRIEKEFSSMELSYGGVNIELWPDSKAHHSEITLLKERNTTAKEKESDEDDLIEVRRKMKRRPCRSAEDL